MPWCGTNSCDEPQTYHGQRGSHTPRTHTATHTYLDDSRRALGGTDQASASHSKREVVSRAVDRLDHGETVPRMQTMPLKPLARLVVRTKGGVCGVRANTGIEAGKRGHHTHGRNTRDLTNDTPSGCAQPIHTRECRIHCAQPAASIARGVVSAHIRAWQRSMGKRDVAIRGTVEKPAVRTCPHGPEACQRTSANQSRQEVSSHRTPVALAPVHK